MTAVVTGGEPPQLDVPARKQRDSKQTKSPAGLCLDGASLCASALARTKTGLFGEALIPLGPAVSPSHDRVVCRRFG